MHSSFFFHSGLTSSYTKSVTVSNMCHVCSILYSSYFNECEASCTLFSRHPTNLSIITYSGAGCLAGKDIPAKRNKKCTSYRTNTCRHDIPGATIYCYHHHHHPMHNNTPATQLGTPCANAPSPPFPPAPISHFPSTHPNPTALPQPPI